MATDITNWRTPSHNVSAFHNIDKVLSTQTVKSPSNASTFKASVHPFAVDDFKLKHNANSTQDFPTFISETETDGLLILHKGEIVYEHYARGNDESSKHIVMSMTKSITGLLVGILSSQGKLDVHALVRTYVPELTSSIWDNVTVQHCLDMRSGLVHDDDLPAYRYAVGWCAAAGGETASNFHEYVTRLETHTNGANAPFNYCSINTDLMTWVVERATGQKFAELLSELLWQPLEAQSDGLIIVDSAGSARAAGGFCATVRDLARLGQLVLDGGRDVVPASWIDDMLHGGDTEAYEKGSWAAAFQGGLKSPHYRSFWTVSESEKVLMAVGVYGQHMFVDFTNGIVMVKTSSQPDAINFEKIGATISAFKEVRRVLVS